MILIKPEKLYLNLFFKWKNKFHSGSIMSFLKKGKEVERKFAEFLEYLGEVREANQNEDMYEHWDIALYDTKFDCLFKASILNVLVFVNEILLN